MTQVNPEARGARKVAKIKEIFHRPGEPNVIAIRASWISFGGTAAIVTSMGLILGLPRDLLAIATVAWGFLLLGLLTFRIARARGARADKEIAKHISIAVNVLVVSRWLGTWIAGNFA